MKKMKMGCSFGELENNLRQKMEERVFDGKKIVLYEASNPSAMMLQVFRENNFNDLIVVDEDKDRAGNSFFGVTVEPFNMLEKFDENYIILIATHKISKVKGKLESFGYKENLHFYDVIDYPKLLKRLETIAPAEKILDLDEIKAEEFKVLQYVKEICEENHLTYFLSDGTLLGAIRHKGFIPWDDDIDIIVPFSDYDKLLDLVKKDGKYSVLDSREEPLFRWGYSQILNPGIRRQSFGFPIMDSTALGVDVFPIYSLPDEEAAAEQLIARSHELKKIIRNSCTLYQVDKEYMDAKKELQDIWEKVGFYNTKKVSKNYDGVLNDREDQFIYDADAFLSSIDVEFCSEMFSAPIGYDHYMKVYFGDYMTLPPVEKRQPLHNCCYYYE